VERSLLDTDDACCIDIRSVVLSGLSGSSTAEPDEKAMRLSECVACTTSAAWLFSANYLS